MRELAWMAGERRKFEGSLVAWHFAEVAGMFGARLDANRINPYADRRPAALKKTPEREAFESELGWKAIDEFFHQQAGVRPRRK